MQLIGVDAILATVVDLGQIALKGQVIAGEIDGQTVTYFADQRIHGQSGSFAGNVPQTVVKVAKPARRLVEPASSLVQLLIKRLAMKRLLADHIVAEEFDLLARWPGVTGADALDPLV